MKRRTDRLALWGVAAGILAATFLFAYPAAWSGAAGDGIIDTAAPVEPSQCAPCHLDIADVDVEGLIFSHGNHLLVACEACHYRMPHRGDVTERVPMDSCFACHGVNHSTQGVLATGECADCHTKPDELKPDSHGLTWAKEPHAEVAVATGVNRCMMCHEAIKDCDECHAKEAPDVVPMPLAYHPMVTPLPKGPSVTIDTRGPTTMSQCSFCHPTIDEASGERLVFAHADHIARNYPCEACHPSFAHKALGIERPDMMSCYRCHGFNHSVKGEVATEKCEACHPVTFELVPEDHTKKFIEGEHKEASREDPAYCAMCHKSEFCTGCHRGEMTSPNAPGQPVIPADHRVITWQIEHGPAYLSGEQTCGSCHDDPSCKRCHQTVMPHPTGWLKKHTPDPGVTADDCKVCHTDRNTCQSCHHDTVKRDLLVKENCTPCHDEMKQEPATAIQHQSFAEHAVHFKVGEKEGRRPYRCDDCHLGFGRSQISMPGAPAGLQPVAHDLRLCYGCHGALDLRNRQIAPYPGRELCVRCHTDLKV